MIEITLENAEKRFNRDIIFRGWSDTLSAADCPVILGGNGSGKSTAMRVLLGYAPLSGGSIRYTLNGKKLPPARAYRHLAFCSPYLELYEELTVREAAAFHFSLKPALPGTDPEKLAEHALLAKAADRPVKHLSSGMKQRLRLALAFYSDTAAVLLDEPTSNLDAAGREWYRDTAEAVRGDRLFIVASNHLEDEYFFCTRKIDIENFKP